MRFCLTLSLLTILLIENVYSDKNCVKLTENTSLNDAKPIIFNISDDNSDGVITSPGYSDEPFSSYPLDTMCAWSIIAPKAKSIRIDFDDFQLQYCPYNVLELYESNGHNTNSTPIASLCGNRIPKPIVSKGNAIYLIFRSHDVQSYRGFRLHFTIDNKLDNKLIECQSNEFKCRNNNCVKRHLICNQIDECGDGSDEHHCNYLFNKWYPKCGLPKIKPISGDQEYIVGGRTAIRGSWPFVASLRYRDRHSCGAVLINHQWVVSAAHCFLITNSQQNIGQNTSLWSLSFGKHFRDRDETVETIRYVDKIFIHHNYLPLYDEKYANRKENDIALVKLNAPVFFDDYILPICLPGYQIEKRVKVGSLCHVIGWGEDLEFDENPETMGSLKQTVVPIVSPDQCIEDYKNIYQIDPNLMICAGYREGGHDSCWGDSGGPLTLAIKNRWYLLGIVSSGGVNSCGKPKQPGIYTKIYPFISWIDSIITNN